MAKLYIFDMDGTLVDSMPVWRDEGIKVLQNAKVKDYMHVIENFNHMSAFEVAQYVAANGQSHESGAELIAQWRAQMFVRYTTDIQLKPNVKTCLEKIKQSGNRILLASGTPKRLSTKVLSRLGLSEYFENYYDEEIIGMSKKEPDFFRELLKREHCEPKDAIVIDDAIYAIKAAKSAGCHTIAVYDETSACFVNELKQTAERFVYDFKELL